MTAPALNAPAPGAGRIPAKQYETMQNRAYFLPLTHEARPIVGEAYTVVNRATGDAYEVDLRDGSCTCPFCRRYAVCKHVAGLPHILSEQGRPAYKTASAFARDMEECDTPEQLRYAAKFARRAGRVMQAEAWEREADAIEAKFGAMGRVSA